VGSVAHPEIKAENIIMCGKKVKLADVGFKQPLELVLIDPQADDSEVSDVSYSWPPEVLGGKYAIDRAAADSWAFGVLLY
jgi:serine/threonine protein kinase